MNASYRMLDCGANTPGCVWNSILLKTLCNLSAFSGTDSTILRHFSGRPCESQCTAARKMCDNISSPDHRCSPLATIGIATVASGYSPKRNGARQRKISPTSSGGLARTAGSKHRMRLNPMLSDTSVRSDDSQHENVLRRSKRFVFASSATDTPLRCKAPINDAGVG